MLSCRVCVQSEDMLYTQISPAHHKHYVSVRSGSSSSFSPAELAKLLLTQKQFFFFFSCLRWSRCLRVCQPEIHLSLKNQSGVSEVKRFWRSCRITGDGQIDATVPNESASKSLKKIHIPKFVLILLFSTRLQSSIQTAVVCFLQINSEILFLCPSETQLLENVGL